MPADGGPFDGRLVVGLYARLLAEVLGERGTALVFVAATIMHATGHAALAALGGACVRVLAGGADLMAFGSTALALGTRPADRAFSLALLGLAAATMKALGGVGATYAQTRLAGGVAGTLRIDLLDAWLAR